MRTYEKPMMLVEQFHAENAVAQGCYYDTYKTVPKQTVQCVIEGTETIFEAASNCSGGGGYLVWTGSSGIYIWAGSPAISPTDEQTAALAALEIQAGHSELVGQAGWHAGYISYEQYQQMNLNS